MEQLPVSRPPSHPHSGLHRVEFPGGEASPPGALQLALGKTLPFLGPGRLTCNGEVGPVWSATCRQDSWDLSHP